MLTPEQLREVMRRVATGDRSAFATLYNATSAKLYGVVFRILRRRDLTDEVVQDTFVKVWKNAQSFDPGRASVIAWMSTIARNGALDEVRKKNPFSIEDRPEAYNVVDTQLPALERMEASEDLRRLAICLDALEPHRRDIVKLAFLEGLSREELGQRFGHPAATIKTWIHRSLKQLKACLSA